ncbi:hypothetical protein DAPPUDRAFT_315253 [Daphnia pulex]|uniref:Uncharacterized protein n=1 Tax=Daphnia pulex TaxID=6669 RepID=E9G973_DAPPU|nr:hypothetical protein DAPPUDRAFT_315253 [Daphnia pulex]|eukprot:EFX84140.1 hypothetical protein DAPPUDRAFT_315253 [Daphnia pulex]
MVVAMKNVASEIEAAATSLNRAAAFIRVAFGPWVRVPLVPIRPIARQPLPLPPQHQDPVIPLEALTAMVEAILRRIVFPSSRNAACKKKMHFFVTMFHTVSPVLLFLPPMYHSNIKGKQTVSTNGKCGSEVGKCIKDDSNPVMLHLKKTICFNNV